MSNAALIRDLEVDGLESELYMAKKRLEELEDERAALIDDIDGLEYELAKWTEPDDEPRWDDDDR